MTTHAFAASSAPYVRLLTLELRYTCGRLIGRVPRYLTLCESYVDAARLADATRGETPTCQTCQSRKVMSSPPRGGGFSEPHAPS